MYENAKCLAQNTTYILIFLKISITGKVILYPFGEKGRAEIQ